MKAHFTGESENMRRGGGKGETDLVWYHKGISRTESGAEISNPFFNN